MNAFEHRDRRGQDDQAEEGRFRGEMDARFAIEIIFTEAVEWRDALAAAFAGEIADPRELGNCNRGAAIEMLAPR